MHTDRTIAQYVDAQGHMPSRTALADLTGLPEKACRAVIKEYLTRNPAAPRHPKDNTGRAEKVVEQAYTPAVDDDQPVIIGITPASRERRNQEEVRRSLIAAQERAEAKRDARNTQRIVFRAGPIGIVYQSDHHIGGESVDYRRLFADQQIIRDTPGLYVVSQGDETNNMIVSKLERVRREAPITITEEDEVLREYWAGFGEKLLAIVLGNHNGWAYKLAGRDPFFNLAPRHALFDPQEVKFTLEVGDARYRHILRHKVRGSSIYNTLHGAKQHTRLRDDADVVIAGHIHRGACYEVWYDRGDRKIAGSLGTYKFVDEYDREEGFMGGGQGQTLTIIFDERGRSYAFDDLQTAADFLTYLRGRA